MLLLRLLILFFNWLPVSLLKLFRLNWLQSYWLSIPDITLSKNSSTREVINNFNWFFVRICTDSSLSLNHTKNSLPFAFSRQNDYNRDYCYYSYLGSQNPSIYFIHWRAYPYDYWLQIRIYFESLFPLIKIYF